MPLLAGIPISDERTLELAVLLDSADHHQTSESLVAALEAELFAVPLTIPDREAILTVLDDPPSDLAKLRGVLLHEHEARVRDGIV
jgi:hypothetical protein